MGSRKNRIIIYLHNHITLFQNYITTKFEQIPIFAVINFVMLRKSIHIIISLVLLVSTTGLTISKHYSMGQLFDVSYIGEADHCCPVPCDCCQDDFEFHKLEVEFVGSDVQVSFDDLPSIDLMLITALFEINPDIGDFSDEIDYTTNLPPPKDSFSPSFTQSFLL